MVAIMGDEFRKALDREFRGLIVDDYIQVYRSLLEPVTPELRQRAEAFADRIVAADKVGAYLEATAPQPCECCGRAA
jgi:hypothetical protein